MTQNSMPQAGDIIAGRYQLVEEIGRGGFGIIYKARQQQAPQQVALKLMRLTGTQLGPDEMRRRFRREAIMASQLVHPHAVRQLDFGEHQGMFYLSMELVHGHTLGDRIKRDGTLGTDLVVRVARAVLDVLHMAHEKGIVHRDLKPDNIMLCQVGADHDFPKVLDFGAAKTVHGDHDLTSAGTALGSPAYMAPELLMGESPAAASDIYALGLTLGEALVGHKVVSGKTSIDRARNQISPEPLDLPGALTSHELYPWLKGALQKKTQQRYGSSKAMRRALDQVAPPESAPAADAEYADATMELAVADLPSADDDFEANATMLMEAAASPPADDDFSGEATTLMEPSQIEDAPEDAAEQLAQLRAQLGDDEAPTEMLQAPGPDPVGLGDDISEAKTEAMRSPFHADAADQSDEMDATTEALSAVPADDAPTNPVQSTPQHFQSSAVDHQAPTARTRAPDSSPAERQHQAPRSATASSDADSERDTNAETGPDATTDSNGSSDSDYASFGSRGRDFDLETEKKPGRADQLEPTADKDYRMVKTSDGREDRIFLPVLIFGAVLLILVGLFIYAVAP